MRHRRCSVQGDGMGVRTLTDPPGAFICEFTGTWSQRITRVANANGNAKRCWPTEEGFVDPRKFPARWREWGRGETPPDEAIRQRIV
ncbi:hypothetical protein ZWY2020_054823 [Hordeum vulgare]|nr:hypothetical protein ZWY2020_054823 [Hordeum vulgare]